MCQYGPCTRMTRTALKHLAEFRFYFQRFISLSKHSHAKRMDSWRPCGSNKKVRLRSVVSHKLKLRWNNLLHSWRRRWGKGANERSVVSPRAKQSLQQLWSSAFDNVHQFLWTSLVVQVNGVQNCKHQTEPKNNPKIILQPYTGMNRIGSNDGLLFPRKRSALMRNRDSTILQGLLFLPFKGKVWILWFFFGSICMKKRLKSGIDGGLLVVL